MKYGLLIVILIFGTLQADAKYTDSFIVKVRDRSIMVSSPKKKVNVVSVIIENETLDTITSQLKSSTKVIKRFVLNPEGKEVLQVDMKNINKLYFVPLAPPSQAVELKFSQGEYEIPEKE